MKKQYVKANRICLLAKTQTAVAKVKEVETGVSINVAGQDVELSKLQDFLETMEEGEELTAEYLEFEDGESIRAVIIGTRKFKTKETKEQQSKVIDAITLFKDGRKFIAAQSMLVSNLMDAALKAEPTEGKVRVLTPVQIEYLGKKKATVGFYDDFRITYLNPKQA